MGVLWTTVDVVHFVKVREGEVIGPVVLWIGIAPETLRRGQRIAAWTFSRSLKSPTSKSSIGSPSPCLIPSPITFGAGTEGFTEDYAIVKLDSSKIKMAFRGSMIDLGMFRSISLRPRLA